MTMKKMKELQDQTTDELKALFHDLSKEIFELKNEISISKKIDKPHLVSAKKRTRARILTLMNKRGEKI